MMDVMVDESAARRARLRPVAGAGGGWLDYYLTGIWADDLD
jgi:hypothetical protein